MAARPHDEERPDEARADEPAPDGSTPGSGADAQAGDERPPAGHTPAPQGEPEPSPDDVDARWREIVSQLADLDGPAPAGGRTTPSSSPWPAARPGPGPDRVQGPEQPAADEARVVRPATGPRSWSPDPDVEEAEDHFEPPEPGPVLSGDPLLTMAWTAVVGLPVLLVLAVVLWRDMPSMVLLAAGVAFVLGLGLLLWRMPPSRDDDRGPGAVV